ncbi:M18 family aminopeptidase [Promicromonospora sp. NPDC060271]|uniref:M18 family aminopeptidase n=1 Tax=Promicromonospora sp. NPDC060271 TaxID=3347089 RepID=UPI00365CDE1C
MTAQTSPARSVDPVQPSVVPDAARAHAEDLGTFVAASPSSYHAAQEVARRAEAAGFTRLAEDAAWAVTRGGRYVVVRDGSVIAFTVPDGAGPTTAFTIVGAHTDSTGFKLKPKPTTHGAGGWWQVGVEVYGGPLLNSWLDRELELAGRIVTHDGTEHLVRTGPMLRIPQLAIHLDRGVNDNGLTLDKQRHTQPVWGLGDAQSADVLAALAADAGVDPADIGGYDVVLADTQPARAFGAGGVLFASARLDNLLSTHAGLTALLGRVRAGSTGAAGGSIQVFAAFDHEEIGSESRSGAAGPFLEEALVRVSAALGATAEDRARAFAASLHVSSDVGHAVHPNYSERHDPANRPVAGGGPILKINANQRYATDAHGAAAWSVACRDAGVPTQEFVSNNVLPCGSTIGPISATRLGIRTVDIGVAILSMHSARELTAVVDPWYLTRAMEAVLAR